MAENKGSYKVILGQIMSSPLITINENLSVRDAIALMQSKQIRRLPVMNDEGVVIGLITLLLLYFSILRKVRNEEQWLHLVHFFPFITVDV